MDSALWNDGPSARGGAKLLAVDRERHSPLEDVEALVLVGVNVGRRLSPRQGHGVDQAELAIGVLAGGQKCRQPAGEPGGVLGAGLAQVRRHRRRDHGLSCPLCLNSIVPCHSGALRR